MHKKNLKYLNYRLTHKVNTVEMRAVLYRKWGSGEVSTSADSRSRQLLFVGALKLADPVDNGFAD